MKQEKKAEQKLNQDINRMVVEERFPESNMTKESVEDARKMKGTEGSKGGASLDEAFPEDVPQGAD